MPPTPREIRSRYRKVPSGHRLCVERLLAAAGGLARAAQDPEHARNG